MIPGGLSPVVKILLVIAVIVVIRQLLRRNDRAGGTADPEAVVLLEDVRATLDRLEERVANLETLLPGERRKDGDA